MSMNLNWHLSRSLAPPEATEKIKEGYAIRNDIHLEETTSEYDEPLIEYVYNEAFLTEAEYAAYLSKKNKAYLDYLAMEMEVEL